jgi:hypothetical protein
MQSVPPSVGSRLAGMLKLADVLSGVQAVQRVAVCCLPRLSRGLDVRHLMRHGHRALSVRAQCAR